ncbi:MAG: FtsQ-type POTRA domain-containing protein [Nibricoccus sp.]
MSTLVTTNSTTRTWRDIQQTIAPKAMSPEGRKRLIVATIKSIAALFALGLAGWGGYELMQSWGKNPMAIKSPVKSEPVKTIDTRTDGVLDTAWVTRVLSLPKNAGLMDLDLKALQSRLLETGQIRNAVLTRKFPATLIVMLEERWPVARVHAQVGDALAKDFLVARDGVIYDGVCYDAGILDALPYLADVNLKRMRGQFLPLEGMDKVADLLSTAHANVPDLFRNWKILSLKRYDSDGFIIVQSPEIKEIVFGTREEDFFKQLARLDLVIEKGQLGPDHPAKSVNLAISSAQGGAQVPVVFETPVLPASSDSRSSSMRPATRVPAPRSPPQRPSITQVFFPSREL